MDITIQLEQEPRRESEGRAFGKALKQWMKEREPEKETEMEIFEAGWDAAVEWMKKGGK